MTTTSANKPINSTETTFSYAAAASGKNSAGSISKNPQTNGSPKSSTPSSVGPPPTQRPVSSASSSPNTNGSTAPTTRTSTPQSLPTVVADSQPKTSAEMNPNTIPSAVSSPRIGSASTSALPKEDDSVASISFVSEDKTTAWEKQSQTSSREDKKTSSTGSRTPDVSKDVTLVPAPLPPVNPWDARRNTSAKKPNAPVTVPATPAVAKTTASNATAVKDSTDKLAEPKQAEKKKKPIGENLDVFDREKSKEGPSGFGKDSLARESKDRKKSTDAGRANGYASKDDGTY